MKPRDIWFLFVAVGIIGLVLIDPCGFRNESKGNETSAQALVMSSKTGEDINAPKVQARGPIVGTVVMRDFDEQYYIQEEEIKAYLAAEAAKEAERLAVQAYLDAQYQEQLAREAAARPAPPRVNTVVPNTGSGDCAAVAAVVGSGTVYNESRGNPLAENGIYKGCAQIGLPWWNGACAGLNWTNPSDQATCAQIVMRIQGPSAWATTYSN